MEAFEKDCNDPLPGLSHMRIDDLLPLIVHKTKSRQQVLHPAVALLRIVSYLPQQRGCASWKDLGQMDKVKRALRSVVDFHFEWDGVTRGRRHFDGMMIPTGVELWAGRAHLIVEPLFMRGLRVWMHGRVTGGGSTGH